MTTKPIKEILMTAADLHYVGGVLMGEKPDAKALVEAARQCEKVARLLKKLALKAAVALALIMGRQSQAGLIDPVGGATPPAPTFGQSASRLSSSSAIERRAVEADPLTETFLDALQRAETGHGMPPGAVGDRGRARGPLQFWEIAWRETSRLRASRREPTWPYAWATNRAISRAYARDYLRKLQRDFTAAHGHPPTRAQLVALWNAGPTAFRRRGFCLTETTKAMLARMEESK